MNLAFEKGQMSVAFGMCIIAFASIVGTLRFGVSTKFTWIN